MHLDATNQLTYFNSVKHLAQDTDQRLDGSRIFENVVMMVRGVRKPAIMMATEDRYVGPLTSESELSLAFRFTSPSRPHRIGRRPSLAVGRTLRCISMSPEDAFQ